MWNGSKHTKAALWSTSQLPENPTEAAEKLAAFNVKDGDDVVISQIQPYNSQAVYLEGHVFHSREISLQGRNDDCGPAAFLPGRVAGAGRARELARLLPPDYRPETIPFNLPDVLIGNNSIPLQPFDLIRVFGEI